MTFAAHLTLGRIDRSGKELRSLDRSCISAAIQEDEAHDWQSFWTLEGHILTCPWHGAEFDIAIDQMLFSSKLSVQQYPLSMVEEKV